MIPLDGMALGWLLIVMGAVLLLIEVHSPGFFATVPATVMIALGIMVLLGIDIYNSGWGAIAGVTAAIVAGAVTVYAYGRMTPNESPTTVSRDSLVGREGIVIKEVDPKSLNGKVTVSSADWSAHSTGATILKGKKVRVVSSEGVHIVVEEVT
ncbi:MAG: NfeD family protein [Methanoregula sp.]|nr:MAG: NfeD family protein [Methanoregula sp.]